MDDDLKQARDAYKTLWQKLMAEGLITAHGGGEPVVQESMTTIGNYLTQAGKKS
jgi:hypothetical protein